MRWGWQEYLRMLLWAALFTFILGVLLPASLRGQDTAPDTLTVQGPAHKLLTAGFDTARAEKVFCVWWHESASGNRVWLDSAMVPLQSQADSIGVKYAPCPKMMATAHWHFLDYGAWNHRSPADSAALVDWGNAFGVLIIRRRFGDRIPLYKYYDR